MYKHFVFIRIIFWTVLLFLEFAVHAQPGLQYNANIRNGLPSNHIYCLLKDRLGYLWIGTDKGVVKYNGYEFKFFGSSEGISNEDVWALFQDKNGKIWLLSRSDEIGYIYQDRYHKAWLLDSSLIYPGFMQQHGDDIVFLNIETKRDACRDRVGLIHHDTVSNLILPEVERGVFLPVDGQVVLVKDDIIYKPAVAGYKAFTKACVNIEPIRVDPTMGYFLHRNYIVSSSLYSDTVYILNVKNYQRKKFIFRNERVFTQGEQGQYSYLLTHKNFYRLDSNMNIVAKYPTSGLLRNKTADDQNYVTYLLDDPFWKTCVGTYAGGLFINYVPGGFQKIKPLDRPGYRYIGMLNGADYYWNGSGHRLLQTGKNFSSFYDINVNGIDIVKVIPGKNRNIILVANIGFYELDTKTRKITPVFSNINKYINIFGSNNSAPGKKMISNGVLEYIQDGVCLGDRIYSISRQKGFFCLFAHCDSLFAKQIDDERWLAMFYDQPHKRFWLYNETEAFVYNESADRRFTISKSLLRTLGINRIEKVVFDKTYRWVFVKANKELIVFDLLNLTRKHLFKNQQLNDVLPYISNNTLILAGRFGTLFSLVSDRGISPPVIKHNTRGLYYSYINDAREVKGLFVLNTDTGTYSVAIPTDTLFYKAAPQKTDAYKFIITNNDSSRLVSTGDTIAVHQNNKKILLDIINPLGAGNLRFRYFLQGQDTTWNELNGNELHLAKLEVGRYYSLKIQASDNIWRSEIFPIKVFLIPYWWQTPGARITAIILSLLFIYLIIYTTRTIVAGRTLKQRILQELELKAIYSQINPHFIFNTLNSVQLLIEKKNTDDAYVQVNRFSILLRSYLQSSRNKYITIGDEVNNLKNYIELQQARFKGKFQCEFIINNAAINNIKIPSLLLQPIIENAITHGLFHKKGQGHLWVIFWMNTTGDTLFCKIEDDGVGRKRSKMINDDSVVKHTSYGGQLIETLINIFNRYEKMEIDIKYTDKEHPETGTIVGLSIKNFKK